MKKNKDGWLRNVTVLLVLMCLALTTVLFKAFLDGKFDSVETLKAYVSGFGVFAPLILIFIQATQVVVPVLPGFLGCAVGAILFGSAGGFLCNYIGICLGSVVAFFLARKYGVKLVLSLFPQNKYEKWSGWAANSSSYVVFLLAGMVLPLFPDDFFCYFTGLTKMRASKFVWIILLGKPWCILAYSLGFSLLV